MSNYNYRYAVNSILLVFVALGSLSVFPEPQPALAQEPAAMLELTPTGDELFDRYAQACMENNWVGYQFDASAEFPATLHPDVLAAWEDDFGSDPRYWQLCYFCMKHRLYGDKTNAELFAEDEQSVSAYIEKFDRMEEEAVAALRQAEDRGVADSETMLLLHPALLREWDKQYELYFGNWSELEPPTGLTEIGLHREYEERELEILLKAVELDPEQAWAHYTLAKRHLMYGEPELAQAALVAGNRAAVNELPACFPLSFVLDCIDDGRLPGNAVLAGAILEAGSTDEGCYPYNSASYRWYAHSKEQLVRMNLGGGLELTQQMYAASCRRALAGRSVPHIGAVMAKSISVLASHVAETAIELTPAQSEALQELQPLHAQHTARETDRALAIQREDPGLVSAYLEVIGYGEILGYNPFGSMMVSRNDSGWYTTPDLPDSTARLLNESRYLCFPMYRFARLYDLWAQETAAYRDYSRPVFERIRQFDITTLEYPED